MKLSELKQKMDQAHYIYDDTLATVLAVALELGRPLLIEGAAGGLTDGEIELLPIGAMMMTYECGMRFLTDYISGDTYFRIHREGQNLDRARNQFKLLSDMEESFEEMQNIVKKYTK